VLIAEEAFTGNDVFSQVLKRRNKQQQTTHLGTRAVPQREQEKSEMSTRTQQESAATKTKVQQQYSLVINNSTTTTTTPTTTTTIIPVRPQGTLAPYRCCWKHIGARNKQIVWENTSSRWNFTSPPRLWTLPKPSFPAL